MAKFCSNCGAELNEEQVVCLKCGVSVKSNTIINKTNNTSNASSDKQGLVGFILGLVSIVAWFIPLFGYPVTICGIIFSAKGLKSVTNKSKATVGLILSIVFLVATLINSILGMAMTLNYYY